MNKIIQLIGEKGLKKYIEIITCPWMISFVFKDKTENVCNIHRTYFLKCMIQNSVLFQGVFVPCFSHGKKELDFFLNAFKISLDNYIEFLENDDFSKLIEKQTRPVFRKYN